jgi:Golgi SNAP receptor complex protein 1
LEAQLDDQMIAYRKLVSMKSDGSENDIEADIERSLKQLQQVNSQMQTWVSSGGSEVLSHTLTRHMEILQDLTQVHIASHTNTLFITVVCLPMMLIKGQLISPES